MRLHPALLATSLIVTGCADQDRLNVFIVTFDTTRADRMSCYGYFEPSSPNIDDLAKEGTLFTRAFATNPITLPSHTSIMTGTYPLFHGVRDNTTYTVREDATTLAEILTEQGYDTAAFVGAFVLDSRFNLDQGFAEYDDRIDESWSKDEIDLRARNAFGFPERKAGAVTKAVLDWLERPREEPFFLWAHYFDPHQPVNPPEPHKSYFSERYAAEIAYADEQLGQIIAALEEQGEYDRTLIVMTADHGEGLMDHGEPTHSLLVFDTTMRVPLIVRMPGQPPGQRLDRLTSIVDIMPSILDLLELETPDDVQGVSFAPQVRGRGDPSADREIYMESLVAALHCGWGELRALRTDTDKLIHGPKPRLYAVAQDSGEVYDRAMSEPEALARMTADLEESMRRWGSTKAAEAITAPDPDVLQKLAALGYVGGGGGARGISDSLSAVAGKPDPYDNRGLFDRISVARESIRGGDVFPGIQLLLQVINADPGNAAAHVVLGKAYYLETGRFDLAREHFARAVDSDPFNEDAHFYLCLLARLDGDLVTARRHAEAILDFQPHAVGAFFELAAISDAEGNVEETRENLERLLAIDPSQVQALVALGVLHLDQEDLEEAGTYFKQALDLAPQNPHVLYNVGIWHWKSGSVEEAVTALQRAMRLNPTDGHGYFGLGRIFYEQSDAVRAREAFLKARELIPAARQHRHEKIDEYLRNIDAFIAEYGTQAGSG